MRLRDKRILIVEDEPLVAMDIQFSIEKAGGTVGGPAASCDSAFAVLREFPVHAAILDFNLAEGDSTAVAEALDAKRIPILFYTGGGIVNTVRDRWPHVRVLMKPCRPGSIIDALQQVL